MTFYIETAPYRSQSAFGLQVSRSALDWPIAWLNAEMGGFACNGFAFLSHNLLSFVLAEPYLDSLAGRQLAAGSFRASWSVSTCHNNYH